ncbi:MAG: SBBP repeat-containing protein [Ignavibacteria bacterium]
MKKISIIFFVILTLYCSGIYSQVNQEWVATYSGTTSGTTPGYNYSYKCLTDKENNVIVIGRSTGVQDDAIVLKYNPSGNLLWERRYNGIGNEHDRFRDAVLDDSNNIYVTGETYEGSSGGTYNWITVKYKPNGDTAWLRIFKGPGQLGDVPSAMVKDKNNNIYITGYCTIVLPVFFDMYTIKYSSDGEFLWERNYASISGGQDRGFSITADDSNNVYASGYGSLLGGNEIVTIKYNTYGDEIWIKKLPTNGGDFLRPTKSIIDKYNNVIVNGYYDWFGQYAFITIKYNTDGDTLWKRIYKGTGNLDFCHALCTDDSANVYAAGRNTSTGTGNDFLTIKYNQFGDTSWIRILDGGFGQSDEIYSIAIDSIHNVYVTGRSDSTNGMSDYLTVKYNGDGNLIWLKKYDYSNLVDRSISIYLDNNNNIIVSGFSERIPDIFNITTIKYSLFTDINNLQNLHNSYNFIHQNYPNPFNPVTSIKYYLNKNGFVIIKIYNSLGKEVKRLIEKDTGEGEHNLIFNGEDLPSGIYFYSLTINGNLINTKRMALIK